MAQLTWTKALSVNVESLDNQHKYLFQLINEFYANLSNNKKEDILKLVENLVEYTKYHFTSEESFMKMYNFPELEEHQREHKEFVEKTNNYVERIKDGKLIISLEITNFIKSWTSNHIMKTDKKYAEYFTSKNLN